MAGFSACSFLLVLSIFFWNCYVFVCRRLNFWMFLLMRFSSSFFFSCCFYDFFDFFLNVDLLASSVLFPFCFGCLSFSFFSCYVFLNFYIGFSWRMYILFFVFYCVWGPSDNIGAGSPRSDAGGEFSFIFVSLRSLFSKKKLSAGVFFLLFLSFCESFHSFFFSSFLQAASTRRHRRVQHGGDTGAAPPLHCFVFVCLVDKSFFCFFQTLFGFSCCFCRCLFFCVLCFVVFKARDVRSGATDRPQVWMFLIMFFFSSFDLVVLIVFIASSIICFKFRLHCLYLSVVLLSFFFSFRL